MKIKKPIGFTLTELIVAIAILAVLAGLAVPGYFNTVERSRANEALSNLNIIHMGQKIYRINNGTYWNFGNSPSAAQVNAALGVDISTSFYNITFVTGAAGTSYSAKLTRNNTAGGAGSKNYTINYNFGDTNAPVPAEAGNF